MRRFAALLGMALCLSATVASGSAGAAGCPNEAFRIGPSANLPGCRAYELVSPSDKNGGSLAVSLGVHAAPAGGAVRFYSSASFAEAAASPLGNAYAALRGADWATQGVDPAQQNYGSLVIYPSPAGAPDVNRTLGASKVALTPGAIEGGSNLYIREIPSGKLLLVTAQPNDQIFNKVAGFTSSGYVEGTADWSHVLLQLPGELVPGAPIYYLDGEGNHVAIENVYEYVPGAAEPLRLVDVLPSGEAPEMGGTSGSETVPYAHWISADGSRAFFQDGGGSGPIYMREDGKVTDAVSVSHLAPGPGVPAPALFGAASADGSTAYFVASEPLLPGAEGSSLYRWEAPATPGGEGTITDLTPPAEGPAGPAVSRVLAASQDGSYVYFAAGGALVEGSSEAVPSESTNVYVWHDGSVRLIAQTEAGNQEYGGPEQWAISPDGRTFALGSFSFLTPEAVANPACLKSTILNNLPGHCRQVFVYEYGAGTLACASCHGLPLGNSSIGGQEHREHGTGDEVAHSILDGGTVFVDTPNPLVARDSNGVGDVYAWRAASGPELISTGTSGQESSFGDATPSGGDIYFFTAQSLVKDDTDTDVDAYDDRVDGGLASQWPATPAGACEAEGCRGAAPGAPAGLAAGSTVAGRECRAYASAARQAGARAKRLARRAKAARGKGAAARRRARALRRDAGDAARAARRLKRNAKSCGR
jgi:hypothetical protein